MLRTYNNKILIDSYGKLLINYTVPSIEIITRRPAFPYYLIPNYGAGYLQLTTSVVNTVFIDFGDGSEVYEREFSGAISITPNSPLHTYTDGLTEHKVKIWFKLPSKILSFVSHNIEMYGDFPIALSLYNLNTLSITNATYLDDFPIDYGAGVFDRINFTNLTQNNIYSIPLWITRSRIFRLDLGAKIILSNNTSNNVNKLINVQGLESLTFVNGNQLSDVSSNLKNISTLRYLAIGGDNPVTTITPNINSCRQIRNLSFGFLNNSLFGSLSNNGKLTNWGEGLVGMVNLAYLSLGDCRSAPTNIIPGLSDAVNLKTMLFRSCYNTQLRIDDFISNLYASVISIAIMVVGNTVMRNVRLEITTSSVGQTPRPTGTYQAPSGYVQGSSNGTPASVMEMLYVLVKQYRWTCVITNTAGTGNETLTP